MNFFRTVFATCSHFRNYRAFRDVPVSVSMKYLVKLVTLLTIIGLIAFLPVASEMVEAFAQWADLHMPPFELTNGHVTTTVEQPYQSGDTNFLFILDTTGKITQADKKAEQGLLVTADTFVFWFKTGDDAEPLAGHMSLQDFPDGKVDGNYFRHTLLRFSPRSVVTIFVMITLAALLISLIQAYIFALLASIVEKGRPGSLSLAQLLNIAIYSATPSGIIYISFQVLRLRDFNVGLLSMIVYAVFFLGASKAAHDRLPTEEREEDGLL